MLYFGAHHCYVPKVYLYLRTGFVGQHVFVYQYWQLLVLADWPGLPEVLGWISTLKKDGGFVWTTVFCSLNAR